MLKTREAQLWVQISVASIPACTTRSSDPALDLLAIELTHAHLAKMVSAFPLANEDTGHRE